MRIAKRVPQRAIKGQLNRALGTVASQCFAGKEEEAEEEEAEEKPPAFPAGTKIFLRGRIYKAT